MMTWVYRRIRDGAGDIYTVGYFAPYSDSDEGMVWEPIEDFNNEGDARKLVHYLNGGNRD
jgi:hypothetical protein